jgi:hypothetical protein
MDCIICKSINEINFLWLFVAVIVSFAVGAVWHSWFFAKAWLRVFKVELGPVTNASLIRTLGIDFLSHILFGFALFILTSIQAGLAVIVLFAFCVWKIGKLNYQFARMNDFAMAVLISVGYTCVAGCIFILFALI